MAKLLVTKAKGTDLGQLQTEAETAAKALKTANAALKTAQANAERAEAAYAVAQKALTLGAEQVRAATRVL
jgi:hypothetical protein